MTNAIKAARDVVSEADLRRYDAEGFLIVRQMFSAAEMNAVAAEAEALLGRSDLIDALNLRCRFQPHAATGECLFETFDPVIDISPLCAALAADRRILDLLQAVYKEPARMFKDKLIFKPPGAQGYRLHQDFIAWRNFPRSFTTVLVAIDDASAENGCTMIYPGLHRRGALTPEDGEFHVLSEEAVAQTKPEALLLMRGDVAVFGCFAPHFSGPNRSDRARRQLFLSYTAQSDGDDLRTTHYREFQDWLRGKYREHGKPDVYFR